jgi:hypothetical protein
MKNPIFLSFTLIVFSILSIQCSSTSKITAENQNELDPNFAGYTGVLLIIRNYDNKYQYNGIDRAMLKSFKAYYKGEYLMISNKDIAKYSDLDKYRFLIKPGFIAERYYGGGGGYTQSSYIYMQDRKTGKEYKTKEYPGWSALQKFSIAFEALRASK